MIISLKNVVLLFLNSSINIMYVLQNNSNLAYFWHNVFNTLNQTFVIYVLIETADAYITVSVRCM